MVDPLSRFNFQEGLLAKQIYKSQIALKETWKRDEVLQGGNARLLNFKTQNFSQLGKFCSPDC